MLASVKCKTLTNIPMFPSTLLTLSFFDCGGGDNYSGKGNGITSPVIFVFLIDLEIISASSISLFSPPLFPRQQLHITIYFFMAPSFYFLYLFPHNRASLSPPRDPHPSSQSLGSSIIHIPLLVIFSFPAYSLCVR